MNPLYIYLLIGINSTCVLSCCAYFCYTIHLHKKQHKIRETNIKNSIHELYYTGANPPNGRLNRDFMTLALNMFLVMGW